MLTGGSGSDTLTGGSGADICVFTDGAGSDVITDFTAGNGGDKIDLSGVSRIQNFADLQANHLVQGDRGAEINDGRNLTIVLTDVDIADLDESSFIF